MCVRSILFFAALLTWFFTPSAWSLPHNNKIETIITLGSGELTVPPGWRFEKKETHLQLTSPEEDLTLYCLELPKRGNFQDLALTAWKQAKGKFELKPFQEFSPPPQKGWDEIYKVLYDVPARESQVVMSLIRVFKNQAYIALVESGTAGFSRRYAQLTSLIESWKPTKLKEENLSHRNAKAWTLADTKTFEHFVLNAMQSLQIPGAAIATVRDNTITYSNGFGIKKVGITDSVSVDTPFMIGSTTKPLTTLLMARLIDQKKLSWVTPITSVLKDFGLLLWHTACACTGMPRRDLDFIFEYENISPEKRLAQMKEMKPTTDFGETFQYSNLLVAAGGYTAAHVFKPKDDLNTAYEAAMKELIFKPLQMKKTVLKTEEAMLLGAAFPHALDFNEKIREIPLKIESSLMSVAPTGAIWSTAEDLAQYVMLELSQGKLQNGTRIIDKDTLLERRKSRVKRGEKSYYGLGLFLDEEQGLKIMSHAGGTFGFSSDLFFIPDKGTGMVILTNSNDAYPFTGAVKQKYLELTFGAKPRADQELKYAVQIRQDSYQKLRERASTDPQKTHWIKSLTGEYLNPALGKVKLIHMGDDYEMDVGEWKSQVGAITESNGDRLLSLISPPWTGGFEFLVEKDETQLMLEFGQEKYIFKRLR